MASSMTSDPESQSSNRRGRDRRSVLKAAQIVFNDRKSVLNCRIRNLSEGGARLELPTSQLLPHAFELHMTGMPVRHCTLRWAKGRLAGVSFVGEQG
jgi:PilZ domain